MVMRNRHEGSGAPQWWDDLPPGVRARFTRSHAAVAESDPPARALPQPPEAPQPVTSGRLLFDLTRFAAMCTLFSVIILLYLLVALSYVKG